MSIVKRLICGFLFFSVVAHADIELSKLFTDNMVIQRETQAAIWAGLMRASV